MTREYSLAHLSMIAVPPARLADVAAGAGFEWFSRIYIQRFLVRFEAT